MEEHPNSEMDEMMEEMAEDLDTQLRENTSRRRGSPALTGRGQILLYGGFAIILLILIINVFLIFGGEDKTAEKNLSTITARVDLLEKGLNQIHQTITGSDTFEKRFKTLEQAQSRQERTLQALGERISRLGEEAAQLRDKIPAEDVKKVAPVTDKTAQLRDKIPAEDVKKAAAVADKKRSHIVRKGETLFRIASKYGITVDELRRINKLPKQKDIYPGQELLIP